MGAPMSSAASSPRKRNLLFAQVRTAAFAVLAGFHGLLFWQRCADATILDPAVLAKYIGALILLAAAAVFHRIAPAHLRGRKAGIVFWLLVLLLHVAVPVHEGARDLEAELIAVIELGLAVPLAIAIARFAAAAAPPRALHLISIRRGVATITRERIPLPSRAPPFSR